MKKTNLKCPKCKKAIYFKIVKPQFGQLYFECPFCKHQISMPDSADYLIRQEFKR